MSLNDPELTRIEVIDSNLKELLEEIITNESIDEISNQEGGELNKLKVTERVKCHQKKFSINHNKSLLLFALFSDEFLQAIDLVFRGINNDDELELTNLDCADNLFRSNSIIQPEKKKLDHSVTQNPLSKVDRLIDARLSFTIGEKAHSSCDNNDQFIVDFHNWYCDCKNYQSKISNKSTILDKSKDEIRLFNENNQKNLLWQLIYKSKCNQLLPIPYCCHLISVLIILYNPGL
ncbi:hypothetical protein KGF54_000377 [Candida jiufengensis]|uniref:uncharacterized protein n=1 Tax=Candida jiufengensis TaxID=497108 RepID=UPI0022250F19|nr:uncharacterized protein KGF54_000377 [Candida jiufengensis]KAI5956760.1 hypothetical protein KGF54_000377 [Candida jiufengensis]